jgi:hypothetical protein
VEDPAPDHQQDQGAGERDYDLAEDAPVPDLGTQGVEVGETDRDVEQTRQPAAKDGAEDADHNVPEPTPTLAGDHAARQEARDQSDEDEDQDVSHWPIQSDLP